MIFPRLFALPLTLALLTVPSSARAQDSGTAPAEGTPAAAAAPAPTPAAAPAAAAPPAAQTAPEAAAAPAPAPAAAPANPAPAPPPPAVAPPVSTLPDTADEAFTTRVKTLEEQIGDLKEKILLSKTRLQTLQEKVLGGDISSGARVVLLHHKELSSAFAMQSVSYALDGAPVKSRVNKDGELDKTAEFEVFNGPIIPGNHQVTVQMVLTAGTRGVFDYAKDYQFTTLASFTFNAEAGKQTAVTVTAFEKGGFTAHLQDRPAFRFETQVTKDSTRKAERAGALPGEPSSSNEPVRP